MEPSKGGSKFAGENMSSYTEKLSSLGESSRALPQYQSHKKVCALKIKSIEIIRPTISELESMLKEESFDETRLTAAIITPENTHYGPFGVSKAYVDKHNPQAGGYWVQYDDGYESWSPAKAFEEGYTLIPR